jgi:hypothetical protein
MTMSNTSAARGSAWERASLKHARDEKGLDAERLRLTGKEDEGDIVIRIGEQRFIQENKAVARLNLSGWVDEAEVEAKNFAAHRPNINPDNVFGAVVLKRRNHGVGKAFVVMEYDTYLRLIAGMG